MIFLGLDVGQAGDPSAVIADDVTMEFVERDESGNQVFEPVHRVRFAERLPLNMSYPDMVARVLRMMETPALRDCRLVVDATGVGRPVVDMFRASRVVLFPVIITSGSEDSYHDDTGMWHIPKRELVSNVQIVLGHGRLRFAKLPESDVIRREFQNFKLKITASRNATYEAWRTGDHDDLVLAVALAVYFGERYREPVKKRRQVENPIVRLAKAGVV